ncbi:hypothetical protein TgHK011_000855 [Trichoderma gracile]|nr:hypothetical protein TgHK011_000855 [Trichoderma gracile]
MLLALTNFNSSVMSASHETARAVNTEYHLSYCPSSGSHELMYPVASNSTGELGLNTNAFTPINLPSSHMASSRAANIPKMLGAFVPALPLVLPTATMVGAALCDQRLLPLAQCYWRYMKLVLGVVSSWRRGGQPVLPAII